MAKKKALTKTTKTLSVSEFPRPNSAQFVAVVQGAKGRDIHEIRLISNDDEDANGLNGKTTLATLVPKWRGTVWIKRGSYVLFEPLEDAKTKLGGEILFVYQPMHIKQLQKEGLLSLKAHEQEQVQADEDEEGKDDESEEYLWVNTNRMRLSSSEEDTEEDTSVEDDSEEITVEDDELTAGF